MKRLKGINRPMRKSVPKLISLTLMANLMSGFSVVFAIPTYAAELDE